VPPQRLLGDDLEADPADARRRPVKWRATIAASSPTASQICAPE